MTDRPLRRLKVFVLIAAWTILLVITSSGFLERVEHTLSDRLLVLQARDNQPDGDIVIVDIDDYSIQVMRDHAGRWPWPRSVHAEVIDALHQTGARLLMFDILFSEPDIYRPEDDAYFAEVVERTSTWLPSMILSTVDHSQGVSLASVADALGAVPDPEAVANAKAVVLLPTVVDRFSWKTGLINISPDTDGITRKYPLWHHHEGWNLPGIGTRVGSFLGATIPKQQLMVINWQGNQSNAYESYSYADVYAALLENNADFINNFRDRIVLFGVSAAGLHDVHVTPVSSAHLGTQILATSLDNILNGEYLFTAPWYVQLIIGLMMICLLAGISARTRSLWVIFTAAITLTLVIAIGSYLALSAGWLVPITLAILSGWAYMILAEAMKYWQEREERQRALTTFGRFLDPLVVEALSQPGSADAVFEPKNCEITVLFADIRNFTALAEGQDPDVVMAVLNRFYSRQIDIIFKHQGTLDKFIGDTLMAFWGAPVDNPDHAVAAVQAALEMLEALEDIGFGEQFGGFDIGIGIHTGNATVGMVGSERRWDYTVIGDTVNLASRIEGQTKGCAGILISEATHDACAGRFQFRSHGRVQVKGRTEDVHLYEPLKNL